jgi:hypothetical protein
VRRASRRGPTSPVGWVNPTWVVVFPNKKPGLGNPGFRNPLHLNAAGQQDGGLVDASLPRFSPTDARWEGSDSTFLWRQPKLIGGGIDKFRWKRAESAAIVLRGFCCGGTPYETRISQCFQEVTGREPTPEISEEAARKNGRKKIARLLLRNSLKAHFGQPFVVDGQTNVKRPRTSQRGRFFWHVALALQPMRCL